MTCPRQEPIDAPSPASFPDPAGTLFRMRIEPGAVLSLFGPICAVLAGALAARRPSLDAHDLLFLLLAVVLADPVLGGLWTAIVETDWWSPWETSAEDRGAATEGRLPLPPLPHAVPGSLAHRLVDSLGWRVSRWQARAGSQLGQSLLQAGFLAVAAAALALLLGPQVPLLVAASLALCVLGALLAHHSGGDPRSLAALQHFGVPWLVGYATVGGFQAESSENAGLSLLLLLAYTLVYRGYRGLARQATAGRRGASSDVHQPPAGTPAPGAAWHLGLLDGGQVLAVVLLIVAVRPWQASLLGLLVAAQVLWQPRWRRDGESIRYLRGTLVFLVAGLLAAFA